MQAALDAERMVSIAHWTARTLTTESPVPFGADILDTKTGTRLMRAVNAVGKENDPSSHAEVRTVRLACKKLKRASLKGYTMYTTCEPCPMCMGQRPLGRPRPRRLRRHHRRRQPLLRPDPHPSRRGRRSRRHAH